MKMNIRMKVMASVGSVVVLLAVLGILAIYNLNGIRAEFEGLLLASSVERDAFNVILAEKSHILYEEEQYYEEAKGKVDAINGYLDEIDKTTKNEELLENSRKARKGTNDYAELYHKGVAALKENTKRATVLQDAGKEVTDQAEAFVKAKQAEADDTRLMRQISTCTDVWNYALQIRTKEKEYMVYHKAEDFENMKENFALMMQKLDELEEISPDAQDRKRIGIARENAKIYEEAACKWVEDRKTLDEEILPEMKALGDGVIAVAQEASSGAGKSMISTQEASNTVLIVGMIIGLVVGAGVAFVMGGKLSNPVKKMAAAAEGISTGDLDQDVTVNTRDEIGDLANSFQKLIDYMREVAVASEQIAAHNLTVSVEPKSEKDVLGHSFKTMIANLTAIIRQLTGNATELVSAATEISSAAEQVSRGAESQSQQVTQVSTAMEEMTATIVESSKNATDATDGAKGSADTATEGGQIVNETIQGMQRIANVVRESADSIGKLSKSAEQIGEIIGVIDDIADQTNLLALNAAIEAARAGEQGRGFAVVADEVRKLAERTGKATGEITGMVKGIQQGTEESVQSMETGIQEVDKGREMADKAGNSLTEIVSGAQRVMDMVRQIATATEEQSTAAEQISKNIENVASVTKESASGAEQAATAAEELNRQAEGLQKMIAQFKIGDQEAETVETAEG